MICATFRHEAERRKKNSIITTLPLKLDSITCLPEGSLMVKSGDLRGTTVEGTTAVLARVRNTRMGRPNCSTLRTMRQLPRLFQRFISSHLLPFVCYPLHLGGAGCGGLFRRLFAFEHPRHHSGNYRGVEDLHIGGSGNSRHPKIRSPVQGILEFHIFVRRISVWVFLDANDEIWNGLGINRKVATFGLLVAGSGAID